MRCESMKAAISPEINAHNEDIPPVFQQWHAAKAIEGNLGGHVRSSPVIKGSKVSIGGVRDSISASEMNPEAWHGVGWPHSTHDVKDNITFTEGRRPACGMAVLYSEESHSRESKRI